MKQRQTAKTKNDKVMDLARTIAVAAHTMMGRDFFDDDLRKWLEVDSPVKVDYGSVLVSMTDLAFALVEYGTQNVDGTKGD